MASVSLPFWLAFIVDRRENWWALIPGWATAVITLVILLADSVAGEFIGSLVLFAVAPPFFAVYLANREHWWALIPGFVLGGVGLVILLTTVGGGQIVGALVLFSIALPFFIIYLRFREHWWALIPAGILGSTAVVALLSAFEMPEAVATRLLGSILFLVWPLPLAGSGCDVITPRQVGPGIQPPAWARPPYSPWFWASALALSGRWY